MRFKATEQQIKILGANAVNASRPYGMGFAHFEPKDYTPEDIELYEYSGRLELDIDYFGGRMVKLYIKRVDRDEWEVVRGARPTMDYQSWVSKYPTFQALAKSAGIKV